jgi:hypothetical protein
VSPYRNPTTQDVRPETLADRLRRIARAAREDTRNLMFRRWAEYGRPLVTEAAEAGKVKRAFVASPDTWSTKAERDDFVAAAREDGLTVEIKEGAAWMSNHPSIIVVRWDDDPTPVKSRP